MPWARKSSAYRNSSLGPRERTVEIVNATKSKRVPWGVHPALWLFIAAVGLLNSVIWTIILFKLRSTLESIIEPDPSLASSPEHSWLFTWANPWISLALGLLIGLLTAGVMVVVLRRNQQFYIKTAILPVTQRFRWSIMWRSFVGILPLIVMQCLAAALVQLRVINPTVITASFIPMGLLYFEQKKIYQAAKSMLEAKAEQTDGLSGQEATGFV